MNCKTCGFAASDPTVSVCPFCKTGPQGGAVAMPAQAAVWPPAPTAAPTYAVSGYPDAGELQKQRQAGVLMALIPLAAVQASAAFSHLLPAPYGATVVGVIVLAGIYPHFRGCAHWAESKGYPRYEGRVLAIFGWLGVLLLAIRRDKTGVPA